MDKLHDHERLLQRTITASTLNAIQPTWRDEVHAVWINGPVPRSQLNTAVWPAFGGKNDSDSGGTTSGQCNPNANDYTGYSEDGTSYCQASNSNFNVNPILVVYSGNVGLVLDASYGGNALGGSVVSKIGNTQGLDIDGSELDVGENGAEGNGNNTNTNTNNTGTTVEGDASSFLPARAVVEYLPTDTSVRLTVELICETHGFVELTALPISGQYAEINLVRHGPQVVHLTVDKLYWVNRTGYPFLFVQNPLCSDNNNNNSGNSSSSSSSNATTTRQFDNTTLNSNATCPAAITNCCQDELCFCNQNYISGSETSSCPLPEFPICVFDSPDDDWGTCWEAVAPRDSATPSCNSNTDCTNPTYPKCQYGRCYVDVEADCTLPAPYLDITVWGDALSILAKWGTNTNGDVCSGQARLEASFGTGGATTAVTELGDYTAGQLSLLLTPPDFSAEEEGEDDGLDGGNSTTTPSAMENDKSLANAGPSSGDIGDLTVTGSSGTNVMYRNLIGDIIVEVPQDLPKCTFNSNCGDILSKVDVSVTNESNNATRTLRMTLSRTFQTGNPNSSPSDVARPGAEVTGLNVMVWDTATGAPLGIPLQISKNRYPGAATNPTYRFRWWTANILLHLPPSESVDLTFAIVYEQYKGVPAFSHTQLSTVGLASRWLLQQASLGTGGEHFVVDPVGAFARSMVTDVRPTLFDGGWKENVGGADFLLYFDQSGKYQYSKEVTARLMTTGPCLSNVTYNLLSDDGAIQSEIQMSGGRTDDIFRMFIRVRHSVLQSTSFSRLAFFQMGAETYNYFPTFEDFSFGNGNAQQDNVTRQCSGGFPSGTSRAADKLYNLDNGYFRRNLAGNEGPWWIAMGPNNSTTNYQEDNFVVGDRGLVIRSYNGVIRGQSSSRPSVSILCDKIEIGPPQGISALLPGDFVDFKLEFLVLPRAQDFEVALRNQPNSTSLLDLADLNNTAQRVQEQAARQIQVSNVQSSSGNAAVVESHYPIRICVNNGFDPTSNYLKLTVTGQALGHVPVVFCNLDTPLLPTGMRIWARRGNEGQFTELPIETEARQANYFDRVNRKYEIVFNVLIQTEAAMEEEEDHNNTGSGSDSGSGNETATNNTVSNSTASQRANTTDNEDSNNTTTTTPTNNTTVLQETIIFFGTQQQLDESEGRVGSNLPSSAFTAWRSTLQPWCSHPSSWWACCTGCWWWFAQLFLVLLVPIACCCS
ncbi:hypothetical protein ACA910_022639 [Epithemia clementina (nom. ined.)]